MPSTLSVGLQFFERTAAVTLPKELAPFQHGYDIFTDRSILVVALPGHAPGHFGICFHAGRRWIFLIGDAAWSTEAIVEFQPPPRLVTSLLGDTLQYRQTLRALHELAKRDDEVLIVPSHCRTFRP